MTRPHERPARGPAAALAARMQALIPEIETERLRLRAPRIEDFEAYAEIVAGPEGRYVVETPDRSTAWYDFANVAAGWLLRGHGLWSVEPREGGAVLGFVLLGFEPGDHEPELGYLFRATALGRGYAAEAARAARAHGFGAAGLPTLVSAIDPDNTASRRLAERLGAQRDAAAEAAHDVEICIYRHRPDPGEPA